VSRDRKAMGILSLSAVLLLTGCTYFKSARDRLWSMSHTCEDQAVQIYFDEASAEVTPEAHAVLRRASAAARRCQVSGVDVVGLADAPGAPQANLELSRLRAEAVAEALRSAGLPEGTFSVSEVGEAASVTPSGRARPLRRRADVTIHMTARRGGG